MSELAAGRTLDEEVARRIFGVKRLYGHGGKPWDGLDLYPQYILSGKPWRTHSIDAVTLPWFSEDRAAGWSVVERLVEIGLDVVLASVPGGWEIEVVTTEALAQQGYAGCYVMKPTMPEAVCRAALLSFAGRKDDR